MYISKSAGNSAIYFTNLTSDHEQHQSASNGFITSTDLARIIGLHNDDTRSYSLNQSLYWYAGHLSQQIQHSWALVERTLVGIGIDLEKSAPVILRFLDVVVSEVRDDGDPAITDIVKRLNYLGALTNGEGGGASQLVFTAISWLSKQHSILVSSLLSSPSYAICSSSMPRKIQAADPRARC
jgi:hypothetical protein